MSATFRLYIDESGDHTFASADEPRRRYLGLLGVWFRQDADYLQFDARLKSFKEEIFGPRPDDPVILHREDIMNRNGPFWILDDPKLEAQFNAGLLGLVSEARFKMCCVVIDKFTHKEKTYRKLFHPYHYCLAALLERYCGLLSIRGQKGDVLAESRGGTEDRQLKEAFTSVYNAGTRFHPAAMFQCVLTSKDIKLKKKMHCIPGLELADILAHPVKRGMVSKRRRIAIPQDFGALLCDAVAPKFNRNLYNHTASGLGKVWLD